MYPSPIQRLIDLFVKFPGIGPRQAARFVFYILKNSLGKELASALKELDGNVGFCSQCFRSVEIIRAGHSREDEGDASRLLCDFCRDSKRDPSLIAVVEKESDLQNIEKTGVYTGLYHVLGGVIDPLNSDGPKHLHLKDLFERVKRILEKGGKCEVLLATNPTTEGDITALYIERILEPLQRQFSASADSSAAKTIAATDKTGLKISRLGRGLSLGSELEYVDEITLKQALTNRK